MTDSISLDTQTPPTVDGRNDPPAPWLEELPPKQIVVELDRYIVGQADAKKAVAIAIRNRWRRSQAPDEIRDEIVPNNIIMMGPTGVGKSEIARRLARLAGAPFIKVEASKFTEVGYVGRDVESMIRDLVDVAITMVRAEREDELFPVAEERVEERLLDLLLPAPTDPVAPAPEPTPEPAGDGTSREAPPLFVVSTSGEVEKQTETGEGTDLEQERRDRTREKLRKLLKDGKLEEREVEVEVSGQGFSLDFMPPPQGMEGPEINISEIIQEMLPKKAKKKNVKIADARRLLVDEELKKLVEMEDVINEALDRVENHGIVFIDEIDKIAGERAQHGPDVSREGVQRDLLPIVEGSTVQTMRYGYVRTDHILFVAAGAFHVSKPSDLIPELQGRFPIRVELKSLTESDFVRIMTEPENALTKQYKALVASEGVELEFTDGGIREVARIAMLVNERMENIGARRLHTIMTTLLDDLLFDLPDVDQKKVVFAEDQVRERLMKVVEDEDLRNYIL